MLSLSRYLLFLYAHAHAVNFYACLLHSCVSHVQVYRGGGGGGGGGGGSKGAVASLDFGGCTLLFYCAAPLDFLVITQPLAA